MENPTPKLPQVLTSKDSQAYSALSRWQPTDPSPLNRGELSTVISELSEALKPATDQEYILAMAELIEFAAAFGIPCPEPKAVQKIYHEALKHLPADLIRRAVARIKVTWVWANRMPMPADLLKAVKEDHAERVTLLERAKVARLKAPEISGSKNVIAPEKWEALRRQLVRTTNSLTSTP